MNLAPWLTGHAGNRSIHSNDPVPDPEIRFLEYRLAVVADWPDSRRKQVTINAILVRLQSLRSF